MTLIAENNDDFKFWCPADITKSEDGKVWVSGIASTEDEDLQGEKLKQDGIELSYFLQRGFLNDDHSKETGGKVGVPTEAVVTKKGLWVKGYLLDTPRANSIAQLAEALAKSGDRKLGYSVEGKVLQRDHKNPRVITKCWIKDIAITASPINPNTFLDIAKSFASTDCTEIFVNEDTEKALKMPDPKQPQPADPKAAPKQEDEEPKEDKDKKPKKKEEKIKDNEAEVINALEDATKEPIVEQSKVEEKDAEEAARTALSEKKPKEDIEKEINDVPVAKRIGKSEESGDLEKGFAKIHDVGGEREFGEKRVPVRVTTYRHKKSGHHVIVTSKDGAHAVTHMYRKPKDEKDKKKDKDDEDDQEVLGGHIFHDDEKTKTRGDDALDAHLRGFGITHKFHDKKKLLGKAIIAAQDDGNNCEICKSNFEKGNLFVVCEGHSFCGEDCIEKALVSGYAFGVTDQAGGAALRVESLEGSQKVTTFGDSEIKTRTIKFDTAKANGGTVSVTLKDALDFLVSRGIPEDTADRILVLMVKNDGDLTKLAEEAKK